MQSKMLNNANCQVQCDDDALDLIKSDESLQKYLIVESYH